LHFLLIQLLAIRNLRVANLFSSWQHASEDKPYVGPLTKALNAAGVSVWYDGLILEWGDDLRPMTDSGLVNCRYGTVVLSKAFLGKKKWTEHELNGLFAREQAGKKLVLPIWHGIVRDDLLQYSPALADRLAKISESDTYDDVVNSLLGMLGRPVQEQNVQTLAGPKLSEPTQPARRELAKLRRAPGPSQDGEDLSPREIELLWKAAKDSRGEILHSRTFAGEGIRTNGRHFLRDADARTAAEWLGALRHLEDRGFIEPLSTERSFFIVTDKGYEAADHLAEFARWNVEAIVLRTHHVNALSEEHTLSCKAIIAIPARYFDDQLGADGSVMRSLKERRSLLVEGINPMPLASWSPSEVELKDTVDGRGERFQVDGMRFLPAASLKLPILG
jgi:TIR domain